MGRERIILCGGVTAPTGVSQSEEPLALNLWKNAEEFNVALPVDDIRGKFWCGLPSAFLDLIEIATYVYAADQATTRGRMDVDTFGGSWRRSFLLHIPVREPELWNSKAVKDVLCNTLGFLSDDNYDFTFYPAKNAPLLQDFLSLRGGDALTERPERVVMFSGGLDSLAGAVKEAVGDKRRIVLVNHRPTQKVKGIHTELERLLAEKAGAFKPMFVPVGINKQKKMGREPSQRSRSFLYVALGAAVARLLGLDSVRFYENGVVTINLPVCEQVIGARATRTTHPRVMRGFEELLSILAGVPFRVENPFLWKTKGEVIKTIVDANCSALIGASMSCAHTWEFTLEQPHCGTCSQCIDRRFAGIAAGADEFDPKGRYAVDVFTESIPKDADRIMMASYLERANEFRNMKDVGQLLSAYSDVAGVLRYLDRTATSGAELILDLYRRHATEVRKAVSVMLSRHADDILARRLPGDCVLRIVCESNAVTSAPAELVNGDGNAANGEKPMNGHSGPRYRLTKDLDFWRLVFDGEEAIWPDEKGVRYVAYLLTKHPNELIHGSELAAGAIGDAVVEGQRSIAADDGETFESVAQSRREYQAVLNDEYATVTEKNEATGELEELNVWALKNQRGTEGNEQKQVRAMRQAIRRLLDGLAKAKDKNGRPHQVLCAFGKHLDECLLKPSSRGTGRRKSRVLAGYAGQFIYEPPDGVTWSE